MASEVEIVARLKNEVSSPASAAEKDMLAFAKALDKAESDGKQLAKAQTEIARRLGKTDDAAGDAAKSTAQLGTSSKKAGSAGTSAFSAIAAGAGAAAVAIGAVAVGAVLKLTTSFAGLIAESADFTRRIKGTFAIIGGGAAAGQKGLASIQKIMRATAAPAEEVQESFARLKLAGFSDADAERFAVIRQNLQASGKEGDILLDKMRDIAKEAVLSESSFEEIATTLGGVPRVAEALGKEFGVTAKEAEKLAREGKLGLDDASRARIFKVVSALAKDFDGASKASRTFGERLKSFADVTLIDVTKDLNFEQFQPIVDEVVGAVEAAVPFIKEFVEGFTEGLAESIPAILDVAKSIGSLFGIEGGDDLKATFRTIGQIMGKVLPIIASVAGAIGAVLAAAVGSSALLLIVSLFGGIVAAGTAVVAGISAVVDIISELASVGSRVGGQLIDGLVNAISAGISRVVESVRNLATSAVNTIKGILKIGSPSKVFEGIGENVTEGFERGVAATGSSSAGVAAVSSRAVANTQAATSGGVGMAKVQVNAPITVNGAGDPAAVAAEVEKVFVTNMGQAFERLALEAGA